MNQRDPCIQNRNEDCFILSGLECNFLDLQQRRQAILSTQRENNLEKTVAIWKIGIFFYDKTLLEFANLGVKRACCLRIILTNG